MDRRPWGTFDTAAHRRLDAARPGIDVMIWKAGRLVSRRGDVLKRFFISYAHASREDEALSATFAQALSAAGHRVFFDRQMEIGTAWAEEIERQLLACD